MKILIFGIGYVGTVTGACLAQLGHNVTMTDTNHKKVEDISSGKTNLHEKGLDELVNLVHENGSLRALTADRIHIYKNDIVFITVGTDKISHLQEDKARCQQLSNVINTIYSNENPKNKELIVCIRSTVTAHELRNITSQAKRDHGNANIHIIYHPEFLRESTAIEDFNNPPFIIIGGNNKDACNTVIKIYEKLICKKITTSIDIACLVKLACNAFHAAKISFANAIGDIALKSGCDPVETMEILCEDKVLNCSEKYLKPGYCYGGSCLPKDLSVIQSLGEGTIGSELFNAIENCNNSLQAKTINKILKIKSKNILFIGLSFKLGTGDLRSSPYMELAIALMEKGIELEIYEKDVTEQDFKSHIKENHKRELFNYSFINESKTINIKHDLIVLCKDFTNSHIVKYAINNAKYIFDLENILQKSNSIHTNEEIKNKLLVQGEF